MSKEDENKEKKDKATILKEIKDNIMVLLSFETDNSFFMFSFVLGIAIIVLSFIGGIRITLAIRDIYSDMRGYGANLGFINSVMIFMGSSIFGIAIGTILIGLKKLNDKK